MIRLESINIMRSVWGIFSFTFQLNSITKLEKADRFTLLFGFFPLHFEFTFYECFSLMEKKGSATWFEFFFVLKWTWLQMWSTAINIVLLIVFVCVCCVLCARMFMYSMAVAMFVRCARM